MIIIGIISKSNKHNSFLLQKIKQAIINNNLCNHNNNNIFLSLHKLASKLILLIKNIKDPKLLIFLAKYKLKTLLLQLTQLIKNYSHNRTIIIQIKILIIMNMTYYNKNCFI